MAQTFSDANWIHLNQGIPGVDNTVYAAVRDDAGALIVGGDFKVAGQVAVNRVARWDGTDWTALGSGIGGTVRALAAKNGSVYAGGTFTNAGDQAVHNVARWDGSSWKPLGEGLNGTVSAFAFWGDDLYAGGQFTKAGGTTVTWASPPFQELFDRSIPGWRQDNFSLRFAHGLPEADVWAAHQRAKQELIERVNAGYRAGLDVDAFTIGFARRATSYKRPDLLLRDPARLKRIGAGNGNGRLQILYAGKAHPNDQAGKELIQHILHVADSIQPEIRLVYLRNYDLELARLVTAGVDLWLNTPLPPLEASGTSGMKAALNGVPSLSVLDGWWIEGWIEDQTGWSIGERHNGNDSYATRYQHDADSLYQKLEHVILPRFYQERARYISIMRHCISLNGSFFNAQRMLQQYVTKAYLL